MKKLDSGNRNKIKLELISFFTQFLKVLDLFELSKNDSFVFNPELFKSFEKLDFPDWSQYYPINNDLKDSPLFSINNIVIFPILVDS